MTRLRTTLYVEAPEKPPQVHLDGVFADLQLFGNVAVGQAAVEHDEQLLLAFGQFFRDGGCVFVLGFVGRLDYHTKGLDLLLDAFASHLEEYPAAALWIIGDGEGRRAVEQKIAALGIGSQVTLFGARYGAEKDALIGRAAALGYDTSMLRITQQP